MKEIPLTRGKVAIVDDDMYEYLSQWKWSYSNSYAARHERKNHSQTSIYMHRAILGTPNGMDTDHINMNKLDNRRENLRTCTRSQNKMNQEKIGNGTSKYKGVYWRSKEKKWSAGIMINQKKIHLGVFNTEEEAARAYDLGAKRLYGEFSRTNFDSSELEKEN